MRLVIKGFGEKVAKCMGMCLPFINASIGSNGLEHIINILPFQWFFIFISENRARWDVFFNDLIIKHFLKFPD